MTEPTTITIDGSAEREISNDVVAIFFEAQRQGSIAQDVQVQLRAAIREALDLIHPHLKPEEVEVSTDSFQVEPVYTAKGKMDSYLGIARVTIKGTDSAKIAQLATDVKTMMVKGSQNSVSRKLRTSVEAELMTEAITNFRAKADAVTAAFGYKSWELMSSRVSTGSDHHRSYGKVMAMGASIGGMESAQSIESGKSTITGSVSGTITPSLKKKQ